MKFGAILFKILGKTPLQSEAPNGWGGWLDTDEGKRWEATSENVYQELETAKVDINKRLILVLDGQKTKRLTLNQAVKRVADKIGEDIRDVREHVLSWLEEAADLTDADRDEESNEAIQRWINEVG